MPTPYDGKVSLWHVAGGWVGEPTIEALCQTIKQNCPVADAVFVKTSNDTRWQGAIDTKAEMEINGASDINKWVSILGTYGMEFHAWCVIKGADVRGETAKIVEACRVAGVQSMIMDVEPHDGYWQGSADAVGELMSGVRAALGNDFHIGISVDPRQNYYGRIYPDVWRRWINSVHPQVYWELMGRTPEDVLTETYNVWGGYGLPILPVLQGWASPSSIKRAQDIARSKRGAMGLSYFRLGVISPTQFPVINEEYVTEEIGPDMVQRTYSWEQIVAPGDGGYHDGTHTGQPSTAVFKSYTSARGQIVKYKNSEAAQDTVWAQWNPSLPGGGMYEVSVYIPAHHASTTQARYHIHGVTGAASELLVRLNQGYYTNVWVPLVVYEFSGAAGSGQVNLTDLTGEADREIAFTAVRWRQVVAQTQPSQTGAGFDPPIGTSEERLSARVWPGQWEDKTGYAVYYTTVGPAYHTGADLNLPGDMDKLAPVYAPAPGVVTFSGRSTGTWGRLIIIRHDPLADGMQVWSRLAHVTSPLVKEGDRVERGQQVASVGDAEGQLPYHLHFDLARTNILESNPGHWPGMDEASVRSNYVDPKEFIIAHRPPGRA